MFAAAAFIGSLLLHHDSVIIIVHVASHLPHVHCRTSCIIYMSRKSIARLRSFMLSLCRLRGMSSLLGCQLLAIQGQDDVSHRPDRGVQALLEALQGLLDLLLLLLQLCLGCGHSLGGFRAAVQCV